jgi:amino acid adenylation domain-containing protein
MSDLPKMASTLPLEQQAIRAKCFHPTGTFVKFPKEDVEKSLPERFEKIVQMYPDRLAVKMGEQSVTYSELNAMANCIARVVVTEGGASSDPIGLLLEKGAPLMAAMLGVLKAGKFFVLLDPFFPKARIAAILEDSQARLLLTDQQNVALAREAAGEHRRVIDLESMDFPIAIENLRLQISPNALAYIIYTSGSTGQPKGVVQNHRNLLHRVRLYTNAYQICSADRLSLLPTGTSNAVTHGFTALLTGASLFPYDARRQGSTALASWLVDEKISFCWISSPLFRNLAATLTGRERFPDLRLIQLTSETAFRTDVDLYKKYFSRDCLLSCGLSSSETGLIRSCLMNHDTEISGNEAPLGYAVEDKDVTLLDEAGNEVGFNQVGEIVVRSRYLSLGYWRQPDLTQAKFKPDPHGGDMRRYFTGDLGLMLPDGCLVYKGRKDFRVKIRGYGVEIAEVEKFLRDHPAISGAVVVARPNEFGEARLIAYFTSNDRPGPGTSELRIFLKQTLPEYMIPSSFVLLETLPLTASGKVDRQSLPGPDSSRPELDTPYVEPETAVEKELAKMWAEVLGVEQIGIHDNFLDLGGHSLMATQIISRVINRFRVELPVKSLLEAPTVAEMAAVIAEHEGKKLGQTEMESILTDLESLTEEEAERLLGNQNETAHEKKLK